MAVVEDFNLKANGGGLNDYVCLGCTMVNTYNTDNVNSATCNTCQTTDQKSKANILDVQ